MRFYSLDRLRRGDAETYVSNQPGYNQGDASSCPECGGITSLLTWLPPYRVLLKLYGKQYGDLAFFSAANDFLVSQKFREAYHGAGLTGLIGFDLVQVVGIKSRRKPLSGSPAYFRVNVHYGQAALDQNASGFEWIEPPTCPTCRSGTIMRWKRLVLEEGTWTGEDIFRPRGMSGEIMVSQRFKDACDLNGITNAYFTPAEESGHDFYPGLKDPSELE